jgi:hypothetical protein
MDYDAFKRSFCRQSINLYSLDAVKSAPSPFHRAVTSLNISQHCAFPAHFLLGWLPMKG